MTRQFIAVDDDGNEYGIVATAMNGDDMVQVGSNGKLDLRTDDGRQVIEVVPGCTYEIVEPTRIRLRVK